MKKIKSIVTGGAGFIGSHLADALIREGHEVHIIDNLSNGNIENVNSKAFFHLADITVLKQLLPVFEKVDYVFHLAALPRVQYSIAHPGNSHIANVNGTLNVLLAAKHCGVKRVIFASSSSVYGDQNTSWLREDMVPNPQSPYGLQKYMGELLCKQWSMVYGLGTVSLRYFNVYGPRNPGEGDYALVIPKFLNQHHAGKPLTVTGDGRQTRDFTQIDDVVNANILACFSNQVGNGEVLNIGGGEVWTINKVAELIGGRIKYIAPRREPRDTLADNSLAEVLLGWTPHVFLEEGIKSLKSIWRTT